MSWSVVVPTNRPDRFIEFLEAWGDLFQCHDVSLFVIQDLPEADGRIIEASTRNANYVEAWSWKNIPEMFPRQSDMLRSWGIHRAWKRKTTYTLTLDDDVLPEDGTDLFAEYESVFEEGAPLSPYFDVGVLTTFPGQMRGFPYRQRKKRPVAVQYGGWTGILDYDAPTQLADVRGFEDFSPLVVPVPQGAAVTGCIMNAAWRTEYAPIMWQLPLYEGRYNRFGDIWSCLFAKKVLDQIGAVMVINGKASVLHDRASDPIANLEREAPGIPLNEDIWDRLYLKYGTNLLEYYRAVTYSAYDFFQLKDPEYARYFSYARDEWLALFE